MPGLQQRRLPAKSLQTVLSTQQKKKIIAQCVREPNHLVSSSLVPRPQQRAYRAKRAHRGGQMGDVNAPKTTGNEAGF